MHIVLLIAGVGKRLAPYTEARPKSLMEVGGVTLLERHLRIAVALGARSATLVTGHLSSLIEAEVKRLALPLEIRWMHNAEYRKGSILSLQLGIQDVSEDLIFMDGDVLYHPNALERLFKTSHTSCLLLDATAEESGEEMMIGVRDNRAMTVARRVSPLGTFDLMGETMGFYRIGRAHLGALRETLAQTLQQEGDNVEYENALQRFFARVPVGIERVDDLPWTEIDFESDLQRARTDIAPTLPPL